MQLTGNAPIGTAIGYWQESASHTSPSAVGFIDSSVHNTYANNLIEGQYELIWIQENGNCPQAAAPLTINVFDSPNADAGLDQDLCGEYTTPLNGSAPVGLASGQWTEDSSWSNPSSIQIQDAALFSTTINSLQEGSYQLVWTLINGTCPASMDTVQINVYDPLVADAGDDIYLCDLPSVILNANSVGYYETGTWSQPTPMPTIVTFSNLNDSDATVSGLIVGDYELVWQMENEGGCPEVSDTVKIINYPLPVPDFIHEDSVCINDCLSPLNLSNIVSPFSIIKYSWYIGNVLDKEITAPFEDYDLCIRDTGFHDVTLVVNASNGCVDSITRAVPIFVKPVPVSGFIFSPEIDVHELTDINFYDESLNRDSIWYFFGDGNVSTQSNPVYAYNDSGYYDVYQVVKNEYHCYDTTERIIHITIGENLYIPNAFTPNADGANELFFPVYRGKGDIKKGYSFMVFNRWGQLLFETTEPNVGWDGIFDGKMSQQGVYVYKLTYTAENMGIETKIGHFTLIK